MFRSQQKNIGGVEPIGNLAVRSAGKYVKFDASMFRIQQTDSSPRQIGTLNRIAFAGGKKDVKIRELPAEALTAATLVQRLEPLEIDTARYYLNFVRRNSLPQSLEQMTRDDDDPIGTT